MIHRISVAGFQSLLDVELELGKFSVIVGPSSSGKTALMRALRALTSNIRGVSYVSKGKDFAKIVAEADDCQVILERGSSRGSYKLRRSDGSTEEYTKLSGNVPEDIANALRIPMLTAESPLHFAGQFDRPFLLAESGTAVARVLGDLTNVSIIFEAAREANRRRLGSQAALKLRQSDEQTLITQIQEYRDLPQQKALCEQAEELVEKVQSCRNTRSNLFMTLLRLDQEQLILDRYKYLTRQQAVVSAAGTLLSETQTILSNHAKLIVSLTQVIKAQSILSKHTVSEVPDSSKLENFVASFIKLQQITKVAEREALNQAEAVQRFESAKETEQLAHTALHDTLVQAGVCPTCQRSFDGSPVR